MTWLNLENAILGNGIVQDCNTGFTEVFSLTSGVAIGAASGPLVFDDEFTSGWINFSESGEADLITVNGKHSIVGLLNLVPRFWVSSNDTNADYAENKIVGVSGINTFVQNEGGDEQLAIGVNPSALSDILEPYIEHNALDGLQGGVSGQFYHLTAQQFIDLTSGLSADDQHYHNASAINVDDGCFELVSGTDLQDILCQIDYLLQTSNTMLVNFDIAGSVRNGNTTLCIDNDTATVRFRDNKTGVAAFTARIPENYIPGIDFTARIKWFSLGADTNNVKWELSYKALASGENVTTAAATVTQVVAEPGVARQIVETSFTIPGSVAQLGDVLVLTLRRLGADAQDTSDEISSLIEISLDY